MMSTTMCILYTDIYIFTIKKVFIRMSNIIIILIIINASPQEIFFAIPAILGQPINNMND